MTAAGVRLRSADDVVTTEVHDELCLLRLTTSEVLVVNRTAADVWLLFGDGAEIDTVINDLARAYDKPIDTIGDDVRRAVTLMRDHGFLVTADPR